MLKAFQWLNSFFEKQQVLRNVRLIRCLSRQLFPSIPTVYSFPTSCLSSPNAETMGLPPRPAPNHRGFKERPIGYAAVSRFTQRLVYIPPGLCRNRHTSQGFDVGQELPLFRGEPAVFGLALHGKEAPIGQAAQDIRAAFKSETHKLARPYPHGSGRV
jgi:hypothetical protein